MSLPKGYLHIPAVDNAEGLTAFCGKKIDRKQDRRKDLCPSCNNKNQARLKRSILSKLTKEEKQYLSEFPHNFEKKPKRVKKEYNSEV